VYSFFQNYDQSTCIDNQDCQRSLVSTLYSTNLWLYNIITLGAVEMISPYGSAYPPASAEANTDSPNHPYWSVISAWLDLGEAGDLNGADPVPNQVSLFLSNVAIIP